MSEQLYNKFLAIELAIAAGYTREQATKIFEDPRMLQFMNLIVQQCLLCCDRVFSNSVLNDASENNWSNTWESGCRGCINKIKDQFSIK